MKEKLIRFMQNFMIGRYGGDELSKVTMTIAAIFILLSLIFRNTLFDFLGLLAIFYTYFRMFSKNITKRYQENQWYLQKSAGVRRRLEKERRMMQQRKTHHIYTCPGCGQKIRIPRGKGKKVEISCPKCHTKFTKRI